ncbi:MAG: 4Fe-4S dicluster domain-containing protein [Planctomycetaceae bacterium]
MTACRSSNCCPRCSLSSDGYETVRETWRDTLPGDDFDTAWETALQSGVVDQPPTDAVDVTLVSNLSERLNAVTKDRSTSDGWTVLFRPDPTVWDGRYANNGWLQELPKPLSKLTWDNTAWISPQDARSEGLSNGDVVTLADGLREIQVPVWIMPGQASGCLTLFFGYGQAAIGRVGSGTGANVFPLRTSDELWTRTGIKLTGTGKTESLACTQHHHLMEGRHLARAGTLAEYEDNPEHPTFVYPPEPDVEANFYEEWSYEGHKWGMTIDLTACTGCSACVIACQSENNIPVVGKDEVSRNREMHWIRVDTWFEGEGDEPAQTLHQPVPCMHCEQAPCEVVCPVAATNHSEEGLNQMVYNRCVGTRYCSNNCPYKVRRFNFLEYADSFITSDSLTLLSNPDVTVREQGVMEKCTYCVQRIESARINAHLENREIADGEIVTACQSVCPAQAIRFGDLNDEHSRVRETHDHSLNYGLLANLNTRPRTTYLAEVKNR